MSQRRILTVSIVYQQLPRPHAPHRFSSYGHSSPPCLDEDVMREQPSLSISITASWCWLCACVCSVIVVSISLTLSVLIVSPTYLFSSLSLCLLSVSFLSSLLPLFRMSCSLLRHAMRTRSPSCSEHRPRHSGWSRSIRAPSSSWRSAGRRSRAWRGQVGGSGVLSSVGSWVRGFDVLEIKEMAQSAEHRAGTRSSCFALFLGGRKVTCR